MEIKRKIDKTIPVLIEKLGPLINPLILNFKNENNKLLIFYFHGLYESLQQKELHHADPQNNISKEQFAEFIDYFLGHKFHFIRPEDLLHDLAPDRHYAMITFDDGYFNNHLAVEVVSEYKIPAAFFITTDNMVENKSFWWDIIYKHRVKQGISLDKIREEQQHLKVYKYMEINDYISNTFGKGATKTWSDIDRPFTPAEITSISRNPFVSIGNHTHNHAILTNYSQDEIQSEFDISNGILSGLTGTSPISIAFPNGNYNSLVLGVAEKAGFRFSFSVVSKINQLPVKGNFNCFNRMMATTESIKKEGGYYRLGYKPGPFYSRFKKKTVSMLKGHKPKKRPE